MEFKRKKKRGANQKVRRLWLNVDGYRIVWRKKVFGVKVPARFQACVRVIVPGRFENGSTEMWDYINHNKQLYKTMEAAIADCKQHQCLWNKATECIGIRAIQELFGCKPTSIPKWVITKLDRRVSAVLLDTQLGRRKKDFEFDSPKLETSEKQKAQSPPESKETEIPRKKRKERSDKGKKRGPRKGIKNGQH